jgi:hypothetical protein
LLVQAEAGSFLERFPRRLTVTIEGSQHALLHEPFATAPRMRDGVPPAGMNDRRPIAKRIVALPFAPNVLTQYRHDLTATAFVTGRGVEDEHGALSDVEPVR